LLKKFEGNFTLSAKLCASLRPLRNSHYTESYTGLSKYYSSMPIMDTPILKLLLSHPPTTFACPVRHSPNKNTMNTEDIRTLCQELPGVTEGIKWGHDLVFSVGEKMFCVVGLDQSPTSASFKVTDEEFDEMSSRPGFKPAPYVAKYKWVYIEDITKMRKTEWKKYIEQSYALVKAKLPAKVKKKLGLD
jgi:predicted DNA-binding protein (MmcQ/YjbR family)